MNAVHVVLTQARYNAWANRRLYRACSTLPDEERRRDRGGYFRSVHGTLNHLLLTDRIWMSRFLGRTFTYSSLDQELYADFEELRSERVATDAEIVQWAETLGAEDLDAPLRFSSHLYGGDFKIPLWFLVAHFFNHQAHHRGQATTLLTQCGVDYGVLDLLWFPEREWGTSPRQPKS